MASFQKSKVIYIYSPETLYIINLQYLEKQGIITRFVDCDERFNKYDTVVCPDMLSLNINENTEAKIIIFDENKSLANQIETIIPEYTWDYASLAMTLFTDGACSANGKLDANGAYASVVLVNSEHSDHVRRFLSGESLKFNTIEVDRIKPNEYKLVDGKLIHDISKIKRPSNNRGELLAIISALIYIKNNRVDEYAEIISDSDVYVKLITHGFALKNEKARQTTANLDLVTIAFDLYTSMPFVTILHTHGHGVNNFQSITRQEFLICGNNVADKLAFDAKTDDNVLKPMN